MFYTTEGWQTASESPVPWDELMALLNYVLEVSCSCSWLKLTLVSMVFRYRRVGATTSILRL